VVEELGRLMNVSLYGTQLSSPVSLTSHAEANPTVTMSLVMGRFQEQEKRTTSRFGFQNGLDCPCERSSGAVFEGPEAWINQVSLKFYEIIFSGPGGSIGRVCVCGLSFELSDLQGRIQEFQGGQTLSLPFLYTPNSTFFW